MKCLGSHGATDFDDIIGFKFYQGWWVNGEPLLPCMAPAKGRSTRLLLLLTYTEDANLS